LRGRPASSGYFTVLLFYPRFEAETLLLMLGLFLRSFDVLLRSFDDAFFDVCGARARGSSVGHGEVGSARLGL
jgi:hypothetical protein